MTMETQEIVFKVLLVDVSNDNCSLVRWTGRNSSPRCNGLFVHSKSCIVAHYMPELLWHLCRGNSIQPLVWREVPNGGVRNRGVMTFGMVLDESAKSAIQRIVLTLTLNPSGNAFVRGELVVVDVGNAEGWTENVSVVAFKVVVG